MKRSIGVGGLVALLLLIAAPAADAEGPTVQHYSDHGSLVDSEFCGFDIEVDWQFHARAYIWKDVSGNVTRYVQHGVYSETDRAHRNVAYGLDRQKVLDAQTGTDVFTGTFSFRLPSHTSIRDAGRIEISYENAEIVSVAGPHPISGGSDWATRFCAAMM